MPITTLIPKPDPDIRRKSGRVLGPGLIDVVAFCGKKAASFEIQALVADGENDADGDRGNVSCPDGLWCQGGFA